MGRFMDENRRMLAEMRALLDEMDALCDSEQSIDAGVMLPSAAPVVTADIPIVDRRIQSTFEGLGMETAPLTQSAPGSGDTTYVLKDFFTTELGSWEVGQHKDFGLPQWARDAYLRPYGDPHYFDDAGGDHHLFGAVLDEYGHLMPNFPFVFAWPDGQAEGLTKHHSGWANNPIYSKYNPARGERGVWRWWPAPSAGLARNARFASRASGGEHVEVVDGASLPFGRHVSFFAVWQKVSLR